MKLPSMVKQLQRRLTVWLGIWGLVLWALILLGGFVASKAWVAAELAKDGQALVERTQLDDGRLVMNADDMRVNFIEPNSGFYYVMYAQRVARLSSPSLDGFVLELPQRVNSDVQVFTTQGPQQQTVLVHFTEYELDGRWLDVAVARDVTSMKLALTRYSTQFTVFWLLAWLILILGVRRLVAMRFAALPQGSGALGLDSMQAALFNKKWPQEWVGLADRLHQALIQLRAKKVQAYQPTDTYQTAWPHDLERVIEPYRVSHPDKQIYLKYELKPLHILIDKADMEAALKSLLDNALQWGRSQVWIRVTHNEDRLCVVIDDDGDGMAPERLEQIQQRTRKRETAEEDSGLKQVEQIVYAYQGHLDFQPSEALGGLCVHLCFDRPSLTDVAI